MGTKDEPDRTDGEDRDREGLNGHDADSDRRRIYVRIQT